MAWTSPRTWVSGEVLTAALLNTHVRDNLLELNSTTSTWSTYTPTLTAGTLGNGTIAGRYKQIGKVVHFTAKFVLGSTSAVSTGLAVSLPVTSTASTPASLIQGFAYDVSGNQGYWLAGEHSTTTITPYINAAGTLQATSPFTWATGDSITVTGAYEAA